MRIVETATCDYAVLHVGLRCVLTGERLAPTVFFRHQLHVEGWNAYSRKPDVVRKRPMSRLHNLCPRNASSYTLRANSTCAIAADLPGDDDSLAATAGPQPSRERQFHNASVIATCSLLWLHIENRLQIQTDFRINCNTSLTQRRRMQIAMKEACPQVASSCSLP